jgi:uracil-DNA glycosylase
MAVNVGNDWEDFIKRETAKDYYQELRKFLVHEYRTKAVYPPMNDIFNAFHYTPYSELKVVILGQDPYIKRGEAHGLAFSVNDGVRIPPSLLNIFKEMSDDLGIEMPKSGCLKKWAANGVMLLNAALTVRAGASRSHAGKGWETFTNAAIGEINEKTEPVVFMLWGNDARKKAELITSGRHLILTAAHPSPLAGGRFSGCKHFSKANNFLTANGRDPVDWRL